MKNNDVFSSISHASKEEKVHCYFICEISNSSIAQIRTPFDKHYMTILFSFILLEFNNM